jgi:hypothetical protein
MKSISIPQPCKPVLQGWRDKNGLWQLGYNDPTLMSKQVKRKISPNGTHSQETAANVYSLPSIARVIKYQHAAAGFPIKETWLKAIACGNYASWPGVTATNVKKYCPESVETQKGHMKKQRQNVRLTKVRITDDDNDDIELDRTLKKHSIMVKVIHAHTTMYTDQTGCFLVQSSCGNKLLMVLFEVNGNYINTEPIKNSYDNSLIKAYHTLCARITKSDKVRPTVHILDNEASARFKEEIQKNCDLQMVPPDTHWRNLAERAIQTFQSHFLAILAGVNPLFPMTLWDRLVPQAVLTLNLLCQAKADPKMSAYEFVHGKMDYNKMPLAPLGCAVQMHKSTNR